MENAFCQARLLFESLPDGKIKHEDVLRPIEAGRTYAKELLAEVAQTEKDFSGTTSAEWLESWYVNRVLLAPLAEIEKKLNSGANAGNRICDCTSENVQLPFAHETFDCLSCALYVQFLRNEPARKNL